MQEKKFGFWSSLGQVFNALGHLATACLPAAQGINHAAHGFKAVCEVGEIAGTKFNLQYQKDNDLSALRADIAELNAKSQKRIEKLGVKV